MADDALWHQSPLATFSLGKVRMLALNRHDLEVVELEALNAAVLGRCQGARLLEDHTAAAWASGISKNPADIGHAVESLVSLGLLRPMTAGTFQNRAPRAHRPGPGGPEGPPLRPDERRLAIAASPAPLATVAIVTADRPRSLACALHALGRGRTAALEVIVIDGSREQGSATRAVVEQAGTSTGVHTTYVGAAEAAALRQRLAAADVPSHVLDAGLTPGGIGSGRNIATLVAAGGPLLMQDDDIVADLWADDDRRDSGLVVGGHADLRTWRFFESREEARAAARPTDVDITATHSEVLGRSLDVLIDGAGDNARFDQACGHMVAAVGAAHQRTVRVTFAGVAGDSGRYCSHSGLLFRSGRLREQFWDDERIFTTATSSREVAVVAPCTIVTHDEACMGYCMGIDATSLLPPFMPAARNEDGVWGATLAFADTHALFAHLPWGVRHESERPAAYDDPMPSARQTRIADVLLFVINHVARATFATTPADRLRHLGRLLMDAGRLPDAEFRSLLAEWKLTVMCNELSHAEAAAADPACPRHWRNAVDEYQRTFRRSVMRPDYFLPIEFKSGTLDDGFARAQQFVGRFGELLTWWPEIWEAALRMNYERRDPLSVATRPARLP